MSLRVVNARLSFLRTKLRSQNMQVQAQARTSGLLPDKRRDLGCERVCLACALSAESFRLCEAEETDCADSRPSLPFVFQLIAAQKAGTSKFFRLVMMSSGSSSVERQAPLCSFRKSRTGRLQRDDMVETVRNAHTPRSVLFLLPTEEGPVHL